MFCVFSIPRKSPFGLFCTNAKETVSGGKNIIWCVQCLNKASILKNLDTFWYWLMVAWHCPHVCFKKIKEKVLCCAKILKSTFNTEVTFNIFLNVEINFFCERIANILIIIILHVFYLKTQIEVIFITQEVLEWEVPWFCFKFLFIFNPKQNTLCKNWFTVQNNNFLKNH